MRLPLVLEPKLLQGGVAIGLNSVAGTGELGIGILNIIGTGGLNITRGVSVTGGINANGVKITNLENGTISATSTEAVSNVQLYDVRQQLKTNLDQVMTNLEAVSAVTSQFNTSNSGCCFY